SAAPFQVLLQQVVVMVRRELTLADFVEQSEQKQWQAVTLLHRLLQQIRDILQGGAAEESCLQQLLDDCGRYAQRYGAWPQRWQSEEGAAELLRCYKEELSTGLKQL